jgi:hypothetical protein
MSLRVFHILFIVVSILFLCGLAYWALETNETVYIVIAAIGTVTLLIYGGFFLKKMKRLKTI